jgi:hypothetical protein
MLGEDARQLCDRDGKLRFAPTISFRSPAERDAFSAAVLDTLAAAYPEAMA